ncbi:MAG: SDR family NAD(P)-dependent oxidoreductase [Lautropia sp.]
MKIEGCVALVTGANRGIGEALVQALLAAGAARVHAAARDPALFDRALLDDRRVAPMRLDVTRPDDCAAAARAAGDVTLLVNNAGVSHYGVTLLDAGAPGNLREELEVNLFGILHMFRAFAPVLVKNRGAIANILSGSAIQHNPMIGSYSCTKAAALSMTVGMRALLRQHGLLVAAVVVGGVDTRMSRDIPSWATKSSPQEVATGILAGLARDEEDIDPDPGAVATRARVGRDPKRAERHHDVRIRDLPQIKALGG